MHAGDALGHWNIIKIDEFTVYALVKARILVVEDEPKVLAVMEAGLKVRGFVVEAVGSGKETLHAILWRRPDVFLLDLLLPDLRETALIERGRTWSCVPNVVVSVEGSDAENVRALDPGRRIRHRAVWFG